jgi:hypothetical protein
LEELITNQTSYLEGYESRVFSVLIDCRTDGSCEVSGGAETALRVLLNRLDPTLLVQTALDFLDEEMKVQRPDSAVNVSESIYTRPALYQPSRTCSAFEALAILLGRVNMAVNIIERVMRTCQMVRMRGLIGARGWRVAGWIVGEELC